MLRYLRLGNKRTKTIWWILIIVTVVTFVGGFIFLLGSGLDSRSNALATGAVGTVDGKSISRDEWMNALSEQRAAYVRQYGSEPADRDAQMVEIQTWRALVTQRLLAEQAKKLGLKASDREVVLTLQSSPPAAIASASVFQTDGKFDPQKYAAAMRDPGNNWAPFEQMVRDQLPVRKLQERLISAIKLSEPELREAFRDRFERLSAVVVMVPASSDTGVPAPTDADLQKTYDTYRSRFVAPARTKLEMLIMTKRVGDEEIRAARETAQGFATRARAGEDFASLVRDHSEGPAVDKGGVVDRTFTPMEFGPVFGAQMSVLPVGGVSDPFQDGMRFIVFKLIEKTPGPGGQPGLKVAQLVVKVRPNESALSEQLQQLQKVRSRASSVGLGKAAAEAGLSTAESEFYDSNNAPQALFGVPTAGDWGLTAPKGEISPVFEGPDEFAVVAVTTQQPAGLMPRSELSEPLRQLAEIDARVERAKPRADAMAAVVASGTSLELAAAAAGAQSFTIDGTTRRQPDPRVGAAPDLVGALFASPPGRTVGPIRGVNGWYFGRTLGITPADSVLYAQAKGQLTTEIMQRRQQSFFNDYIAGLRAKAKIEDLRRGTN